MGEGRGFLHGVSDWLFQIDVFARGESVDGHTHMPVVRKAIRTASSCCSRTS